MPTTCWTCGSPCAAFTYRCAHCDQVLPTQQLEEHVDLIGGRVDSQLKVLVREAKSANHELQEVSEDLGHLRQSAAVGNLIEFAQLKVLRELSDKLPKAIAKVESAVRWGCEQIVWHLEQQTDVIRGIDETLKTPVQTRAKEWLTMADTLRERGALNEAIEFYEKSHAESPLDFRTYVGYAEALLQLGRDDEALSILTQSLPHAPRNMDGEISDWRSHSLRTIAHIHHCQGSHDQELKHLQQAVTFSPGYRSARYEMAVAAAECQQTTLVVESLENVVMESDLYFEMSRRQAAFRPYKEKITPILRRAREARIADKLVRPFYKFGNELNYAELRLTQETARISKRTPPNVTASASKCAATITRFRTLLESLENAAMPVELMQIEEQSNHLKQHQQDFLAEFEKLFQIVKQAIDVAKRDREESEMMLKIVVIIVSLIGLAYIGEVLTR